MTPDFSKQLIRHEGLRLKPYKCTAGKLTIGVGRNLDDKGINEQEAMFLFSRDMGDAIKDADRFEWFKKLDDVRQDVIVNMIFNMGHSRVSGFKKMIAAIQEGRYDRAAHEMLDSLWARQVGARSQELSKMMREGSLSSV